jgi:hypothetical protein
MHSRNLQESCSIKKEGETTSLQFAILQNINYTLEDGNPGDF